MKNKTDLIQGIIFCAQGIILDAFALFAIIPTLGNLWFGKLYGDEKSVAVFTLVVWIGISIGASIVLSIGKNKLFECFSDSYSTRSTTYSSTSIATPIFKDINSTPDTPTGNEWKCPNCGKINQNYTGTCGCGQQRPGR